MNAEERREARRRRILENSEIRLKKITTLSSNENVSNGQAEFIKDKPDNNLNFLENNTLKSELPDWSAPKHRSIENVTSTTFEDQQNFNLDPNRFKPNIHSKNVKYEIKFSSITILHMILSQIVLVLFYYDLGFLFGNSIVVPFLLSTIPELYASNEQHDSIHMIVLLMLGFPQNLAKQISRCIKLASVTGKRFCVYIFCFTCSYAVLTNLYFDIRQYSSIT